MRWEDLKKAVPHQWVIIEAIDAYTEGNNRIIEDIQLVDVFGDDDIAAQRRYAQLHKARPMNEYYIVHTDRRKLDVEVRYWAGVRPRR
jgi:hypothetical protein